MFARRSRIIAAIAVFALALSLVRPLSSPAAAQRPVALPAYRELVQAAARSSWAAAPLSAPGTRLAALVQLDVAPLALVGRDWDQGRRDAYLAELAAEQERVAAAVRAQGGTVLARFTNASSGLAVAVDARDLAAIGSLAGVSAVMRVGDYQPDQSTAPGAVATLAELSALLGVDVVRSRGNDGRGIDIAIVDSGIDYTHVKLGGPGTAEAYSRAAAAAVTPPADLFPNAKVRGGFDFVGDVWPGPDPRCPGGGACEREDANPLDLDGHGTHVADIAAGLPSTPDGADAGVAPGAGLWAFKACNGDAELCSGVALLRAIDAAMDLDGSDRGACQPGVDAGCLTYDPADIINLSVSYSYGQPEDALTLFANIASYYGSLVVASAGNDGDKPYIVGSPAAAAGALAVAESRLPGAPAPTLAVEGRQIDALYQPWSDALATPERAALRVGDGQGGNLDGCAPLPAWEGALLLERGGCSAETMAANAAAAGAALLIVADSGRSSAPPLLAGATADLPVFTVAYIEGQRLRTVTVGGPPVVDATPAPAFETIAPDASRGPRIADNWIKPDLAAPGAIRSAAAGSGSALVPFGGSSGAAPVVAGIAALVIQELEDFNILDPNPGLRVGRDLCLDRYPPDECQAISESLRLPFSPLVKAVLMNYAADLRTAADELAPVTQQGAGRVSAFRSFVGRTIAWDATEAIEVVSSDAELANCTVQPFVDMLTYVFFGTTPPCARYYPFGDELYRAWNAQTGSISFGYRPAAGYQELTRQVVVANYSRSQRSYTLDTALRFADDGGRGVALDVTPKALTLPPGGFAVVTLTMQITPQALRDWTLNGGRLGNSGSASCESEQPELDCPSLTLFEVDGALLIDGGNDANQVRVPVHVLPRKTADVVVSRVDEMSLVLSNLSPLAAGTTEAFALFDESPNKCDVEGPTIPGRPPVCLDAGYIPGAWPGLGRSPVDINYVGLRSYAAPGLNAAFDLTTPTGGTDDELVEFAVTVYDKPYRASPNFPVQFEIIVDADRDGAQDYVVFNADLGGGTDGRSAVFVRDLNPADGTRATRPYLFTVADFNSQNWVLPVPAAAIGVASDRPFDWYVLAQDAYFRAASTQPWDCSPGPAPACGSAFHTAQTGALRFRPLVDSGAVPTLTIPPGGRATLGWREDAGGAEGSPSQDGMLLLHRDAAPERESAKVLLR